MSDQPKPIVIVHPEAATKPVKDALRRAGYAVVVSDNPSHFKTLDVMPVAVWGMVCRAAFEAISQYEKGGTGPKTLFGERLSAALAADAALHALGQP